MPELIWSCINGIILIILVAYAMVLRRRARRDLTDRYENETKTKKPKTNGFDDGVMNGFDDGVMTTRADAAITSAIIVMAKSLALTVGARGIEDNDQLEFLSLHGCDTAQGPLLANPVSEEEFVWLLEHTGDSDDQLVRVQ